MPKDYKIIEWRGKQVFTLATDVNVKAMHKAALLVERDVKTHFTGGTRAAVTAEKARRAKGGKAKFGGISPRSKPGQPPAIQIGILRDSIMSQVKVVGLGVTGKVGPDIEYIAAKAEVAAKAETGTDVNYGFYLEIGTKNIQPRPFLRPALKRSKVKIDKIFRNANK